MSRAAFTIKAFGFYVLALGAILMVVPNLLLSLFGVPQTTEVWIRVVGVLAFAIGIYYLYAAKCEARVLFQGSVYTRTFVLVAFAAFVLLGFASPVLVLFGAVDFLGGIWTHLALRKEPTRA